MALLASPGNSQAINLSSEPARGSSNFHQRGPGTQPSVCRHWVLGVAATCWRIRVKTSVCVFAGLWQDSKGKEACKESLNLHGK